MAITMDNINMKTRCLIILLVFSLSACGFQLRGYNPKKARGGGASRAQVTNVYVNEVDASVVATRVIDQLSTGGSKIVQEPGKAKYILKLESEKFVQNVLSVSATTGKVEEYQLSLSLYLSLREASGKELVTREQIRFSKDYTFDEDAVLGTFEEEEALNQELIGLAADEIVRRVNSEAGNN